MDNLDSLTWLGDATCYTTYTQSTPPYNFQEISGTGSPLDLGDDEVSDAVPLGFSFNYFGKITSDIYVGIKWIHNRSTRTG